MISSVLMYFYPAPPTRIVIATGFKGGSFDYFGHRYKERFEQSGLKVELRATRGAVENLRLLQDAGSGVSVGFLNSGISDGARAPDVLSLGTIYNIPYWLFYVGDTTIEQLSQLKGRRIAVGPVGSGARFAAEAVLGKAGINANSAELLSLGGDEAVRALDDGRTDAVWIVAAPDAPAVQRLLRNSRVRLLSFPMADAYTRVMPELVSLPLPMGVVDIERTIPAKDVTLLGTTTKLLVRNDVHPEAITLLLKAMVEEHDKPDLFQKGREFPKGSDSEYLMAEIAVDYYKNGPSLLRRHLPLWLTVHAQRTIALLIAAIAIGVPLFNYLPKLYRWGLKMRTRLLYGRIGEIEQAMHSEVSLETLVGIQKEIEEIDWQASHLDMPRRHLDLVFGLKTHINLVRGRLATRLSEVKSKSG